MYSDSERSLRFYYNEPGIENRDPKFLGYTPKEVQEELKERIDELDMHAALGVMAALEASFRTDYLVRCDARKKDNLSRHFRELQKASGNRVSLENAILEAWKDHIQSTKTLISEIIGAFKFRHWLAHGRYWEPKLGRRYDFFSVYQLAQQMETILQLQSIERASR